MKRAAASFVATYPNGLNIVISPLDIYDDRAELVARYPDCFVDVEVIGAPDDGEPVVEQATRAPGEKRRGPGRPRKVQ